MLYQSDLKVLHFDVWAIKRLSKVFSSNAFFLCPSSFRQFHFNLLFLQNPSVNESCNLPWCLLGLDLAGVWGISCLQCSSSCRSVGSWCLAVFECTFAFLACNLGSFLHIFACLLASSCILLALVCTTAFVFQHFFWMLPLESLHGLGAVWLCFRFAFLVLPEPFKKELKRPSLKALTFIKVLKVLSLKWKRALSLSLTQSEHPSFSLSLCEATTSKNMVTMHLSLSLSLKVHLSLTRSAFFQTTNH